MADSPTNKDSPTEEAPVVEQISEPVQDDTPNSLTLPPVTEAELNAIGAKIMRAELMGNTAKVESLKRELEALRARKERTVLK